MKRIIGVTAVVALLGGIAGALAGAVAIAGGMLFVEVPPEGPRLKDIFLIATVIGFAVGGLFGPLSTWLFLRRVPLWRASTESAFAASLAFTVVLMIGPDFASAVASSAAAAVLAALRLKRAFREPALVAAPSAPPNENL